jgi:hypothetical protein
VSDTNPSDLRKAAGQLWGAIGRCEPEKIVDLVTTFPELVTDQMIDDPNDAWMGQAALHGNVQVIRTMLSLGFNPNAQTLPGGQTALGTAERRGDIEMMRILLEHGANPNLDRPMIGAIKREPLEKAMKFITLLVEYGVDVNLVYDLYGNPNQLFTALDWAVGKPEIAAYLRSLGAKPAVEIVGPKKALFAQKPEASDSDPADTVKAYFRKHFGPPQRRALREIVPAEPAVIVHTIKATRKRRHVTLFTTGLSTEPMTVPHGEETWQYAELFIQLPGDWKYTTIGNPEWGWPIHWLRKMAQYPHHNDTWLGGPVTIVDNEDPPEPLAPNVRFTSMLLMAERDVSTSDGRTIQLYRLTPLYPEERDLERREGIAALMRAFDSHDFPFIVDLNRPNVAID